MIQERKYAISTYSSWSILVGCGYVAGAVALNSLSTIGLYSGIGVTPWSPTTGLSLAYAYIYRTSVWPFLAAAEILTLVVINPSLFSWPMLVIVALATCGIWIAAGSAMRSTPGFDPQLRTLRSHLLLIVIAIVCGIAHTAVYVPALLVAGLIEQQEAFSVSWRLVVGDVVGILVVAPLPLLLLERNWRTPRAVNVLQVAALLAAIWTVFAYRQASAYQLFYLLFMPLLWVALKEGIGTTVLMLNVAQVGIIIGTQLRADFNPGTGSLQILMIALAITGLLVSAIVTERETAAQRLREQQAALGRALRLRSAGETAAAIAHQINQPITAISTYAAVAREAVAAGKTELANSTLEKLTRECDRAAQVMRSIRDLVRQGTLAPSSTRLTGLLEDIRMAHSAEMTGQRITLDIDIGPGATNIYADAIQLEQAIDNLVVNSIEAISETGRTGRVRISVRTEGDDTIVDVEDDGPGFGPGLESASPTPFVTTKRNGSGLGLAIARSVAEAHGGSLAIVNRNSGACVRIRLPTMGKRNAQGHQHH
jgi:signal transduction histidine kinase